MIVGGCAFVAWLVIPWGGIAWHTTSGTAIVVSAALMVAWGLTKAGLAVRDWLTQFWAWLRHG
jgi:hypothetical protein